MTRRKQGGSYVTTLSGRCNVDSSSFDEALHPSSRPNDIGVWGFVMFRINRAADSSRSV